MRRKNSLVLRRWMKLSLFLLATIAVLAPICQVQAASLVPAGSMAVKRFSHTAEPLADGRVLVVGGATGMNAAGHEIYTNTAEIYTPATNAWSSAGSFAGARGAHYVKLLQNGKVLVFGGATGYDIANDHSIWTRTAVLYDPSTNSWSSAGSMSHPHVFGGAIVLDNGKVLITGGAADETPISPPTNTFDLYDPATNSWSSGTMAVARGDISCNRLFLLPSNGKVLVVGGRIGYDALAQKPIHTLTTEIYNPATNNWDPAGNMSHQHASADGYLLDNGKVFITGGQDNGLVATTKADIYNPATNSWSSAGNMVSPHYLQDPVRLADGRLFIAGGKADADPMSTDVVTLAEIYSPATNSWSSAGNMLQPHYLAWPVLLANGKILIAGGANDAWATTTTKEAELYDPVTNSWSPAGNMITGRLSGFATAVPGGKAMVMGGFLSSSYTGTTAADFYDPLLNSWSVAFLSEPKAMLFTVTPLGADGVDGLLIAGGVGNTMVAYASADKVIGTGSPVTCGVPSSLTVPAADADGSYSVSWGASATAGVTYVLQEATNSTFTAGLRTVYSGVARTAAITGRLQNKTYFYRVKATKAGATASAYRTAASGCAVPGTVTTAPPASIAVPLADADGAFTVSWGASTTASVTYVLQEATNPTFTAGLRTAYSGTARSKAITGRALNKTYYYRVKATKAGCKDSTWRSAAKGCAIPGTATVAVPASITVPASDADGAYTVSWGASTTASVTYMLQEATNSTFTLGLRTAYFGTLRNCAITGRATGKTYYYRVSAVKAGLIDSNKKVGSNGCAVGL